MKKETMKGVLPAVMMFVSALGVAQPATAGSNPETQGGQTPAVLRFQPPTEFPESERLEKYVKEISSETGYVMRAKNGGGNCATISGSDGGWDDSDCF
ncbi:MAG TPA: hypothetical protein VFA47_05670 [Candidatus Manganitrophaceae bacterium]|nr:hypothetical protein [Candidatus Manganitrophaceae bacterium]